MIDHVDKGILEIKYNYLNLPGKMKFSSSYIIRNAETGEDEARNVRSEYIYRADGTKLRKKYYYVFKKNGTERTSTTDYLDGFQYTINYLNTVSLDFVPTSEGYYNFKNNKYIYNYTDQLGNVRLSYQNNGSGVEVLQENNYYPFGLKHQGYNSTFGNPDYGYQYNGKELQDDTGMLDYGWRQYIPELGRWNGMDQLSEAYHSFSPYAYVMNNSVNMLDPDGRLTQAQLDYVWNNSKAGVTSWGFNRDGSPVATGYSGWNSSIHDAVNSIAVSGRGGGYVSWWTDGSISGYSRSVNGQMLFGVQEIVYHKQYIGDGPAWEAYKNLLDWSSTVAKDGFEHVAKRRTTLYTNGYWMDNLGNIRSVSYAGRARGSLIGLRSDYVRTTAMYGKYAKQAGYVGYAISAAQIGYGVYEDKGKFGKNAQVATAGVAGGMAGAAVGGWAGTKSGTLIGASIGVWFEGVGAVPAGAIGGIIGGITGSILGGFYGGDYAEEKANEWLK